MIRRCEVAIVGTDPEGRGGIASVLRLYEQSIARGEFSGCVVVTHRAGRWWEKLWTYLVGLARLLGLLIRGEARVVHIHTASRRSFTRKGLVVWLGWAFRRCVVIHLHGGEFPLYYRVEAGVVGRWWIRRTFGAGDAVVFLSENWLPFASEIGVARRVRVIPNPVESPGDGQCWGTRRTLPPLILFLGRIEERKGCVDLLKAFVGLRRRYPDVRLAMAGDGDLERMRRLGSAYGVDGAMELPGWVEGSEKESLLRRARVLALPSYSEAFPMAILEGMAWGLPVVATGIGGIPDLVEAGVTGFIVEAGDAAGLEGALEVVVADAERAAVMGQSGRDKVGREFSWAVVLRKVLEVYGEVCDSRGRPLGGTAGRLHGGGNVDRRRLSRP